MADYRSAARAAARKYGLDPGIFERQIGAESGFNPNARSPKGAAGIAQIMPATARGWGVDPMDPIAALDAAAKNMRSYVKQYGGYENALRAYNAGPGAIQKSKGYAETNAYVSKILNGKTPKAPTSGSSGDDDAPSYTTSTTTTPGVDNRQARAQLILSFLNNKGFDPVDFATQARELRDVPGTTSTTRTPIAGSVSASDASAPGGNLAAFADQRASIIDKQALPYQWGGGHAGKTAATKAIPLDCSGAVSKVLGIDPRVADQFKTWGRPGDGGNKGVTVYSKPTHTLMKINGRFFGTSSSNPGGGAGWIDADQISPGYLSGFTARHSNR